MPFSPVNGSNGGLGNIAARRHKASEVLFADQVRCCLLHCIELQRFLNLVRIIALQDVGFGGVAYLINVLFAQGIKAGMKLRVYFLRLPYSDISNRIRPFAGQQVVCRNGNPVCRDSKLSLKTSSLPICMNACICAACALQCDFLLAQNGKYPFQFALNGAPAGLPLPTGEVGAVVFNCQ